MILSWAWNVPTVGCQARKVAGFPKGANAELGRLWGVWGEGQGQGQHALSRLCAGVSDGEASGKDEAGQC